MGLYIPTSDIHERHLATGLTRFSLDEIAVAAHDLDAARAEYDAAIERAAPAIAKYDVIWGVAEDSPEATALLAMLQLGGDGDVSGSTRGRDLFPVTKWVALAKRYRSAAARINRAVDDWERAERAAFVSEPSYFATNSR